MTIDTSKWNKVSFGDVARCLTVATKDPLSEGLERYVGLEHIEPGNIHIKSWGEVAKGTTFTRVFRKGQVLFGKRRAYQKKAALAEFDGICSSDILVCEAIEGKLIPELLPFVVQSDRFFDFAIKTSAGSLSPRTKFKDLAKFSLKLPSKPDDQKRIADLLWSVDSVEQNYITLLKKLHISKNSYFRETHESRKAKPQSISEIVEVNPRLTKDNISADTTISFIAMADISEEGYIVNKENRPYREVKNGLTPFEEGDILFAKITPCMENGKGAIAVGLTNGIGFGSTEFHVLRPKNADDRYYLYYLSMMKTLRKKAEQLMTGTAGQKRVPSDFFDFYKVRFPEASERKTTGQRMKTFDEKIDAVKDQIKVIRTLKKQIINQIFG